VSQADKAWLARAATARGKVHFANSFEGEEGGGQPATEVTACFSARLTSRHLQGADRIGNQDLSSAPKRNHGVEFDKDQKRCFNPERDPFLVIGNKTTASR
jgi:hypothetical protein